MRFLFIFAVLLAGCLDPNYNGKCTTIKENGKVTSIEVNFPSRAGVGDKLIIRNREEAEKFISGLENIVLDLKAARDQMTIVEPVEPMEPVNEQIIR